jgi:hypothetical protein
VVDIQSIQIIEVANGKEEKISKHYFLENEAVRAFSLLHRD